MALYRCLHLRSSFYDFYRVTVGPEICPTAIFSPSASLFYINDCVFSGFSNGGNGGAFYMGSTDYKVLFELTTFTSCSSMGHGGAVYMETDFAELSSIVYNRVCSYGNFAGSGNSNSFAYNDIGDEGIGEAHYLSISKSSELETYNNNMVASFHYGNQKIKNTNCSDCRMVIGCMFDIYRPNRSELSLNSFVRNYASQDTGLQIEENTVVNTPLVLQCNFALNNISGNGIITLKAGKLNVKDCVCIVNLGVLFYQFSGTFNTNNCWINHENTNLSFGSVIDSGSMYSVGLLPTYIFQHYGNEYCQAFDPLDPPPTIAQTLPPPPTPAQTLPPEPTPAATIPPEYLPSIADTIVFTPIITPEITPDETPNQTPEETPVDTLIETPNITPDQTLIDTLIPTFEPTLIPSPFETPFLTPEDTLYPTLIETPMDTLAMSTLGQTPESTFQETPADSPLETLAMSTLIQTPEDTVQMTVENTPIYTNFASTPVFTFEQTPLQTISETYQPTLENTLEYTPIETFMETPINTLDYTPIETFIETPINTLDYTPIETFIETPINTLDCTPIETLIETPINTFDNSPIETPMFTPEVTLVETPFITPENTLSQTIEPSPVPSATSSGLSGGQVAGIAAASTAGAIGVPTLIIYLIKHLATSQSIAVDSEHDSEEGNPQHIVSAITDDAPIIDLMPSLE